MQQIKNTKKGWILTLEQPSYIAVITYADSRKLRKEIYTAYVTRASDQAKKFKSLDNSKIMNEILVKRAELAKILKFKNYAQYSLFTKMAKNEKQVLNFLNKLAKYSKPKAKKEIEELQKFAEQKDNLKKLQPWDVMYYSEKIKEQKYNITQEKLRKFFPEKQVLSGLFKLLKRLYGINIKQIYNIDVWHKDVKVFAVFDKNNKKQSIFCLDLYSRSNKQSGAWMGDFCARHIISNAKKQIPIAYIVCNFNSPIRKSQSLLTHDDVITLFHEFGHCLQHILTKIDYANVSGINGVPWDAVEIASQFMENWCWQKQVLNMIGQKMPKELFFNMIAAKNFHSGLQMLRQLEFALFDMRLHAEFNKNKKNQIQEILDDVRKKVAVIPQVKFNRFQHGFSHIFGGVYAAGYYSYKWAEVLSADIFAKFEEQGLFNKKVSNLFLKNFLEKGGSVDPMILFEKFRGRAPKINALLKHQGIKK